MGKRANMKDDVQSRWNKHWTFWSYMQNSAHQLKHPIKILKQGSASIMLWGCSSLLVTGNLLIVDVKMDRGKYMPMLGLNLWRATKVFKLCRVRFTNRTKNPKQTMHATLLRCVFVGGRGVCEIWKQCFFLPFYNNSVLWVGISNKIPVKWTS